MTAQILSVASNLKASSLYGIIHDEGVCKLWYNLYLEAPVMPYCVFAELVLVYVYTKSLISQ